jgi:hypothetical protein
MVTSPEGHCLGHIGRENAAKYTEIMTELAKAHDLWCRAQVGGGRYDDGWRIGVWVFMVSPGDLAKQAGRAAAQSVAALESKWREATIIHTGAVDTFTVTLVRMRAADHDPDGSICSSPALAWRKQSAATREQSKHYSKQSPTSTTHLERVPRHQPPSITTSTPRSRPISDIGQQRSWLLDFCPPERLVGKIHREPPISARIEAGETRNAFGLLEPFLALPRAFSGPLHTREVAGSKPAAPIGAS